MGWHWIYEAGHMKQALDHGLTLEKVHRVLKFNQEVWLNSYML